MKLRNLVSLALFGVAVGVSASASASFQLTNTNGTFTVDEFDWASTGTAWTNNFNTTTGTTFTLFFADYAVSVNNAGATVIDSGQGLDNNPDGVDNGYEYTIFATLTEQVTGCTTVSGTTTCSFDVLGGTFNIYYDTASTANKTTTAWTGFQDGINIISGTLTPGVSGTFVATGTTGTGGATLFGTTTAQDFTYVQPTLDGTTATTTLQIGQAAGSFVYPVSVDGIAIPPQPQVTFKADANQQFAVAQLPEPGSLALIGIGLLAWVGFSRRRTH